MALTTDRKPRLDSRLLLAVGLVGFVLAACGGDQLGGDPLTGELVLTEETEAEPAALAAAESQPVVAPPSTFAVVLGEAQAGAVATTPPVTLATTTPTVATTIAPSTEAPTTAAPVTDAPATDAPATAPAVTDPNATVPESTPMTTAAPQPSTTSAQVVEFRIAAGTGSSPWNSFDNPVQVQVGQVLRIYNDDNVAHTVHAGGTPIKHGKRINPGGYQDHLVLKAYQPVAGSPKLYDHNNGKNGSFWVVAT